MESKRNLGFFFPVITLTRSFSGLSAIPPFPGPALFLPGSCQDLNFNFFYSPLMAMFELGEKKA